MNTTSFDLLIIRSRMAAAIIALTVLLAACASQSSVVTVTALAPTPAPTVTLAPMATVAPSATPLPAIPTPAPAPTATVSATPLPTATPPSSPTLPPTEAPKATATKAPMAVAPTAEKAAPYVYKEVVDKDGVKYAGELDFSAQDTGGNMKVNYRVSVAAIGRINEAIQGGSVVGVLLKPGSLDGYVESLLKDRDVSPFIKNFVGQGKPPIMVRVVTGEELRRINGSPIQASEGLVWGKAVNEGQAVIVYGDIDLAIEASMELANGSTVMEKLQDVNVKLGRMGVDKNNYWGFKIAGHTLAVLQQYLHRGSSSGPYAPLEAWNSICGGTTPSCNNIQVKVIK